MTTTEELHAQWRREGFEPVPPRGRFMPAIARALVREEAAERVFRLVVEEQHCNAGGIAHGGFLSALADPWLGANVANRLAAAQRFVTVDLHVDFLRPVPPGDWLESQMDRVKIGSRLCHASGAIHCRGTPVVAMRATFALLGADAPAGAD